MSFPHFSQTKEKKLRNVLQNSLWASVNCLSHTATAFPAQRPNWIKAMLKITFLSHTYSSLWCMFVFYHLLFKLKCSKNIANIISPNLTCSCVFLVAGGGGDLDVHSGGVCYVVLSLLPWDNHSRQWCLPVTTQSHQSAYPTVSFSTGKLHGAKAAALWMNHVWTKITKLAPITKLFFLPGDCHTHLVNTNLS